MSKRIFTQEEMIKLSQNANVRKCSEKSITYDKKFKLRAVERYHEGWPSPEIFTEAGFDILMIGRENPGRCLKRWNKTYRNKGEKGFEAESRGRTGRPRKIKDKTDADKIKRLEAELAYVKAENDFFKQLRAKRAERYSGRNKGMG